MAFPLLPAAVTASTGEASCMLQQAITRVQACAKTTHCKQTLRRINRHQEWHSSTCSTRPYQESQLTEPSAYAAPSSLTYGIPPATPTLSRGMSTTCNATIGHTSRAATARTGPYAPTTRWHAARVADTAICNAEAPPAMRWGHSTTTTKTATEHRTPVTAIRPLSSAPTCARAEHPAARRSCPRRAQPFC